MAVERYDIDYGKYVYEQVRRRKLWEELEESLGTILNLRMTLIESNGNEGTQTEKIKISRETSGRI